MGRRHVLAPGGLKTVCGVEVPKLANTGHTAGHSMVGSICIDCRGVLAKQPQLVNEIIRALADSLLIEARCGFWIEGELANTPYKLTPQKKVPPVLDDRQLELFSSE